MRPVTVKQWERMPLRTKSWLVVKTFGFWTQVWWHIHKDYETEESLSGSMRDEQECRATLKAAIKYKKVPATAVVRRSLGFWACAECLSPGWEVVSAVVKEGYEVTFMTDEKDSVYCVLSVKGENAHLGWGKTLSESICAAALKAKGLLIQ